MLRRLVLEGLRRHEVIDTLVPKVGQVTLQAIVKSAYLPGRTMAKDWRESAGK